MEADYAWCAGLFDGEGSTSVLAAHRDRYVYPRMNITQKIPEVLEKFQRITGKGSIYKAKTRNIHSLDIYKRDDVEECLNMMWPYLSEVKKQQAIKCFERVDG